MMQAAVEFRQISKRFGKVQANAEVSFAIERGTIHGVIGENGAGKSTLMSILYGYYRADSGEILINGTARAIRNSHDAIGLGIGMVHQHFMLVDNFTVLDNIMLGSEGGFRLKTPRAECERRLRELSNQYGLDVDPLARVQDLSVGTQQRVEILKQIYHSADILILDEPTAVLTAQEIDSLFEVLKTFKSQGKTIILITHKLQEIKDITDRVTVMRGGKVIGSVETEAVDKEQLAEMMVGRPIQTDLPRAPYQPGAKVLQVEKLGLRNELGVALLDQVSFDIHAGEIVAIAGVSGNGQSELLEILAGMRLPSAGQVQFQQQALPYQRRDAHGLPAVFRELGIAHIPEDRLREGLVKDYSVMHNTVLGYVRKAPRRRGLLDMKAMLGRCREMITQYEVRPNQPGLRIAQLSGGNQQKIIIGREIAAQPRLILIGQPTRGVDIGTIESIHKRLLALRDAGVAMLLVSGELEEIRSLADRILVMSGGKITGELRPDEFDATRVGMMMGGLHKS